MERLAERFHLIAADLYGCGKSPVWPDPRPMWIDDQIALLAEVFERAGERFHLVGHSYGGAIALKAALGFKQRRAWDATPESRRGAFVSAVRAMRPEWNSAFSEPTPLEALRAIDVPTLLLTGTASMAPVTHPQRVNPLIEQWLTTIEGKT